MSIKSNYRGKACDRTRTPWAHTFNSPGVQNIIHLHCFEVASCHCYMTKCQVPWAFMVNHCSSFTFLPPLEEVALRHHCSVFILIAFTPVLNGAVFVLISHCSFFKQQGTFLNWCSHLFSKAHSIEDSFLHWGSTSAKSEMEQNVSVFAQKRNSVNGATDIHIFLALIIFSL